jgi:NTP pyrophosphatase (non-canonical NTP hydrolase)
MQDKLNGAADLPPIPTAVFEIAGLDLNRFNPVLRAFFDAFAEANDGKFTGLMIVNGRISAQINVGGAAASIEVILPQGFFYPDLVDVMPAKPTELSSMDTYAAACDEAIDFVRDHARRDTVFTKGFERLVIQRAKDIIAKLDAAAHTPQPNAGGLSISDLQRAHVERQEEWCPDQKPDLSFRGNELGGECGEAQNVIKKLERERHGWRGSRDTIEHLAEELGDVIHCAVLCAITAGIDLEPAVIAKFNATSEKNGLASRVPSSSKDRA